MKMGVENSGVAIAILDRNEELRAERASHVAEWEAISRLYRPERQGFNGGHARRDAYSVRDLYNAKTLQARQRGTASVWSTLVNPANRWFGATIPDQDLAEWRNVKIWLETVTSRMLMSCGPAVSNFYSHAVEWTADTVCFGNGVSYDEIDTRTQKITDVAFNIGDVTMDVDAHGRVNEIMIERHLTPVQAARFYGLDVLPKRVRERATDGKDKTRTRYVQAVQPNDDFTEGHIGQRGRPVLSTHVSEDGKAVVQQGAFYEQPASVARWEADSGSSWGRGLGYLNLPGGSVLQSMEKHNLTASALAAKPPLATSGSRELKRAAQLSPGAFLHGGLNAAGQQMVRPVFSHQGVPITMEMQQAKVEEIETGWGAAMLTLQGRTGLGPLEVMEMLEERLRQAAPFIGRIQSEGLGPKLERRFALLWRAGQIPPPPRELSGQPLEMTFTSVAALAQRAQEGAQTRRFILDMQALSAVDETARDNLNGDYLARALQETGGVSAHAIRDPEEVKAIRDSRAQAQNVAAMAEVAKTGSEAAANMAQIGGAADAG